MKKQTCNLTKRPGPIVCIILSNDNPDTEPTEASVPDIDEIDSDTDREIDADDLEEEEEKDNIDKEPTVNPGTDTMDTDSSQTI